MEIGYGYVLLQIDRCISIHTHRLCVHRVIRTRLAMTGYCPIELYKCMPVTLGGLLLSSGATNIIFECLLDFRGIITSIIGMAREQLLCCDIYRAEGRLLGVCAPPLRQVVHCG